MFSCPTQSESQVYGGQRKEESNGHIAQEVKGPDHRGF